MDVGAAVGNEQVAVGVTRAQRALQRALQDAAAGLVAPLFAEFESFVGRSLRRLFVPEQHVVRQAGVHVVQLPPQIYAARGAVVVDGEPAAQQVGRVLRHAEDHLALRARQAAPAAVARAREDVREHDLAVLLDVVDLVLSAALGRTDADLRARRDVGAVEVVGPVADGRGARRDLRLVVEQRHHGRAGRQGQAGRQPGGEGE